MPARFISCIECGGEIDTDYDDYNRAPCGCCWSCSDCANGYRDDDGDGYDDGYGRDRRVHPWDYRPEVWRPKGNYPTEPLLGLELEIGGRERTIAPIVAGYDPSESHLYMKQDGSITGVEIVTHPATLRWSRTFDWAPLLQDLSNAGCEIDDGYGLHVHVSRNAFRRVGMRSTPHQMAWLMFMYRHSTELEKLARRTSNRWAKFGEPERGELKRKSADRPSNDDRYVAVNCNNSKTYELRFFRSTLNPTEVFAALEFADASVEYTRGLKASDILRGSGLTWQDFTDWVMERDYPALAAELPRVASELAAAAERTRRAAERRTRERTEVREGYLSRALSSVGSGGVVVHRVSGERYAVARSERGAGGWFMRAISPENGAHHSWMAAANFIQSGWDYDVWATAPSDFFPANV